MKGDLPEGAFEALDAYVAKLAETRPANATRVHSGSALEVQAEMERQRLQVPDRQKAVWTKLDDYPTLSAAARSRAQIRKDNPHSSFEHGLSLLINGLRQRHAELQMERAAANRPKLAANRNAT